MLIEQQVDGETLIMLASHGSLEQMQACGLKAVKQQMHFRKLISSVFSSDSSSLNSSINTSTRFSITNIDDCKLTLTAMKQMKKEEIYIYLIK